MSPLRKGFHIIGLHISLFRQAESDDICLKSSAEAHAQRIIRVEEQEGIACQVLEKPLLLFQSIFETPEAADMGFAYYREYSVIRPDHPFQPVHLPWKAYTGLNQRHLVFGPHPEEPEGRSHLGVVRKRRPVSLSLQAQYRRKHLFYQGLTVAAGDPDHRTTEPTPIRCREVLQGIQGVRDLYERGAFRHRPFKEVCTAGHNRPNARGQSIFYEVVPVEMLSLYGPEYVILAQRLAGVD